MRAIAMRPLSSALLVGLFALLLAAPALAAPRPVQLSVGDQRLAGLYWDPPKSLAPAVLLLPMLGHTKEDWIPFGNQLRRQGYGVLALDFREQGRTNREPLLADARAGFDFLREQPKVDAARIGLIGASIGANAALNFAATEPAVRLAVLLSPGLNYRGVTTEPALRDYGARPLLLLAAEEDSPSAAAVRRLAELAQGESVVKLYPGAAHGTELLAAGGSVGDEIIAFLRPRL